MNSRHVMKTKTSNGMNKHFMLLCWLQSTFSLYDKAHDFNQQKRKKVCVKRIELERRHG